jgi:hypothetical protein
MLLGAAPWVETLDVPAVAILIVKEVLSKDDIFPDTV